MYFAESTYTQNNHLEGQDESMTSRSVSRPRTLNENLYRGGFSSGLRGVRLEAAAPGHLRLYGPYGRQPEGCRGAVRRAGVVQPGYVSSAHHGGHPRGEKGSAAGASVNISCRI